MKRAQRLTRRQFVSAAAATAGAALLPDSRRLPAAHAAPTGHSATREKIAWKVQPFPLTQVRLGNGPFKEAMELDRRYLHSLSSDRLLYAFHVNAGLSSTAEPVGGWEKPDCELRGHFGGGHFLTAMALMYASTRDEELKAKGDTMVAELAKCQRALGSGYLSAFPTEFFDRLRDGKKVWAPFYTLHKIMAGNLDMYTLCDNDEALKVAEGMAGWVGQWAKPLSDEHMARVFQVEHGGMMEVLCNLYGVTGKEEYLDLARRFDHRKVFDPLAAGRDELKGLHANTNIPKITGAARFYELTGEQRYHDIADYFWREVVGERTYCNGGTSNDEHWRTDPGKLASELSHVTGECCCAYNMLKLTRHLYGWTADPRYFDYYERTLFNTRLGTQNPEDGMMMYFVPLASGYWKFFNSPLNSFWCCTGTGVEEYAKLGDSIYFHDRDGVYVNLFINSEVNWPEIGVRFRQETDFPEPEGTTFTIESKNPVEMALNIRVPYWATGGAKVKLNGKPMHISAGPSTYITLHHRWINGDKVEVGLPMSLRIETLPDDRTIQAVMYGPVVLAGRLGSQGLTRELVYGGYDPALKSDRVPVPDLVADGKDPVAWVEPVANQPLTFRTVGQAQTITLIPFYKLFGERYVVYWKVKSKAQV